MGYKQKQGTAPLTAWRGVFSFTSKWLRWSRGSVLAFGTPICGFKPGRSRRIFQGEKLLSMPSFGREVKSFAPCRRFTACKRPLNVTWKSGIFMQNSSAFSRPSSSSIHYQGLWWRHLAVQVGRNKDQGLYNKPSAAVHPGTLAAGTLPQYNSTIASHPRKNLGIHSMRGQLGPEAGVDFLENRKNNSC